MIFCVDYENVNNAGIENGCQYLDANDKVVIFYSGQANKINKGTLAKIFESGCDIEDIGLLKRHDNAMDFYIASYIGTLVGENTDSDIAIISNDNDYKSVIDFFEKRSRNKKRIILASTLTKAMTASSENKERQKYLIDYCTPVSISGEINNMRHIENVRKKLRMVFRGTEYENEKVISEIVNIFVNKDSNKELYLASLHVFGKNAGLEIYRKLKDVG